MNFSIPVIDPHIHQWDLLNTPRILSTPKRLLGWNRLLYETALRYGAKKSDRAYVGRTDYVAQDYLPADYGQDSGGVPIQKVVHVEAEWRHRKGNGPAGETRWLHSLFEPEAVTLGAIVGYVDLQRHDARHVIEAHIDSSDKFVGIRQMLANDADDGIMSFCPQPGLSMQPQWRSGFELLEEYQLSFDAWVFHHQLDEIDQLAKRFPSVTFILDHMGTAIGIGGPFASYGHNAAARDVVLKTWQTGIAAVAENPNVVVKLSGQFMPVLGWGFEHRAVAPGSQELLDKTAPLFNFVLQQFGVDRCLFASNFPMDKVSLSFRQLYELYAHLVQNLPQPDQKKLFHDNAARVYKIQP
ncbi:MAG: amidohydrolase [Ketobacter sp.]|nr:MAG: amidohydrolase [Ketobacter sp.]